MQMWNYRKCDTFGTRVEGHVTLEFSNTTTLPAKIYANEGVAQMLFLAVMKYVKPPIKTEVESTRADWGYFTKGLKR